MSFSAKIQRTIHAPVSAVWAALTQPELVKQYFWGTSLVTSWQPGMPIAFEGEWEGKPYRDKGTVLVFEPEKRLRYDYHSSWSDLEDRPENYQVITYRVKPKDSSTLLIVSQHNIDTPEKKIHAAQNWAALLTALKRLVEKS